MDLTIVTLLLHPFFAFRCIFPCKCCDGPSGAGVGAAAMSTEPPPCGVTSSPAPLRREPHRHIGAYIIIGVRCCPLPIYLP